MYFKDKSLEFYYIQGNHDTILKNNVDGDLGNKVINSIVGKIGGVYTV